MKDCRNKGFSTRAVHSGKRQYRTDWTPVVTPIYSTVGYLYQRMDDLDKVFGGEKEGFVYTRYGNPTVVALEEVVASLELAEAAQAYASGMAALHAALLAAGLRKGTSIVTTFDLYGATTALLERFSLEMGVRVHRVDMTDLEAVETVLDKERPALLLVETISNPLMKVADVPSLAEMARRSGAQLIVDNTFASPYLFNPIAHGAHYVVHSLTKYIGGHGDVTGGIVVTTAENRKRLNDLNRLLGAVLGPFEAWLTLRGCQTLALRMAKQCESGAHLARWLASHPQIAKVHYPGLPSHPQHDLACRLFAGRGFGGMLSFEIREADRSSIFRFVEALELCLPATTLGDVYSLVLVPAISSHRGLSAEQRAMAGITDGLVRLSVGIEDTNDIIADLERALATLSR